jgi:peptidoglycan/LPS O-acetylase OafA/YrhL
MKQHIDALTATRGIAALLVVVFHYGCTYVPFSFAEHFFRNGNLAVSYFFVLSGFVMYYTYGNKTIGYANYMRKRIARIAPLYWFALLLSCILPLSHLMKAGNGAWGEFGKEFVLHAGFLQALVPGEALTLNVPGWSLSVEMCFYFMFPALLLFAQRSKTLFLYTTALLWAATQVWHIYGMLHFDAPYGSKMHEVLAYGPWGHINQFMMGIAAAMLYMQMRHKQQRIQLHPVFLFAATVLVVNYMPAGISMHNGLLAPLFGLLIINIAQQGTVLLRTKPLVYLGEISFGIYILQFPVYNYWSLLNDQVLQLPGTFAFYAYLIVLLLCSALCYYMIEKPLRKRISGNSY